jgi:hypothetical protein
MATLWPSNLAGESPIDRGFLKPQLIEDFLQSLMLSGRVIASRLWGVGRPSKPTPVNSRTSAIQRAFYIQWIEYIDVCCVQIVCRLGEE